MKRRGRPPVPPGVARNQRVVTFVTDGEFRYLNRLSEETGTTLSATVYQLLTGCLEKRSGEYTTNLKPNEREQHNETD